MAEELRLGCARFDDLGVLRVLATGGKVASVQAFVDEWLGPLLPTDARQPGELLDTLTTFLDVGANQRAAADALGIHVSTMRYRLRRIGEITGRDINSAETRFEFQLAYQAWKSLAAIARQGG
jgi:DNA-binding PucR family transcriptional regulator